MTFACLQFNDAIDSCWSPTHADRRITDKAFTPRAGLSGDWGGCVDQPGPCPDRISTLLAPCATLRVCGDCRS